MTSTVSRTPLAAPARGVPRRRRWARLVLAATLLAVGGIGASAAPASAAACSGTSGVTVVVDFGSSESIRCAAGDPSSGFDALARAGFSVTRVQQFPSAVCRINGYPANDPCVQMPPTTAYWSYWHAQRGGSWSYYSVGPGSSNPAPGTVEGWAFGAGKPPSVAPPAPSATSTSTSSSTSSQPKSTTSSTARESSSSTPLRSTSPSNAPKRTSSPARSSGPSAATAPTSQATVPTASATTSATTDQRALAPVASASTGSGVGGLLAGLALIGALAGVAGLVAWRRRST